LLLIGFGVLPVRGVLYTLTQATGALAALQTLDGVANAIFVTVAVWSSEIERRVTGRFYLGSEALTTAVGIGAALSTTIRGILIQHEGYRASLLTLAAIALLPFAFLWFAVPLRLGKSPNVSGSSREPCAELTAAFVP
jgi:predicted MFS family arabinose efflux permease